MTELFGLGISYCVLDVVGSGGIPRGVREDAPLGPPIFECMKIGGKTSWWVRNPPTIVYGKELVAAQSFPSVTTISTLKLGS